LQTLPRLFAQNNRFQRGFGKLGLEVFLQTGKAKQEGFRGGITLCRRSQSRLEKEELRRWRGACEKIFPPTKEKLPRK